MFSDRTARKLKFVGLLVVGVPTIWGLMLSSKAQAQFVCGGSANGGEAQSGALATANVNAMACGPSTTASGIGSVAIGTNTGFGSVTASGTRSVALGTDGTVAKGFEAVAIGSSTFAGGDNGVAIGGFASSGSGKLNTAVGYFAAINPGYEKTTVVGGDALVNGSNTVAFGAGAGTGNAKANNAVAIGQNARVGADNATAVGQGTSAKFANSAAFGQGATTTRADQQVFGTSTNTYTMSGITSAASQTAQGAPTALVTSNANGDLAAHSFADLGLATSSDLASINQRLDGVDARVNRLDARVNRANEGVAMAFAMAGVPTVLPHEKIAVTANWGNFEGENGFAAGAALRLDQSWQLNAGVAAGSSGHTFGSRVGVRLGW